MNRIQSTTSLCPDCLSMLPAEIVEIDGRVYLQKTCAEHGSFEVLIHSNSDEYHYVSSVEAGGLEPTGQRAPASCCGGACNASPAPPAGTARTLTEHASTCIALIELVETCNLACPTCYADSPLVPKSAHRYMTPAEFWQRIDSLITRKGEIEILQLSGGEPTVHPQFVELLEQILERDTIGYVLVNTNGVRLANDEEFAKRLGELHARHRGFEIYLQFDGQQEAEQVRLRGLDLRAVRRRALEVGAEYGMPFTLAMTTTEHTLPYLGDTMRFALEQPTVRGITFQPLFTSGRNDADAEARERRLNVADITQALIQQSRGMLTARDFTPLPCGNPNCHTIGYLIDVGGTWQPISRFVDLRSPSLQGLLRDRINFSLDDLTRCGCDTEPLGQVLERIECGPKQLLRLFIKPFMDAHSYDQDRIDRCCVHVVLEGGRLDSFCRHYAMRDR